MERLRLERWSGILLTPRTRPCCLRQQLHLRQRIANTPIRSMATAAPDLIYEDGEPTEDISPPKSQFIPSSPPPEAVLQSTKLSALHARLFLPKQLPLQTLARTLVDTTADPNPDFNNSLLAVLGGQILSLHVSEWLTCKYPRLPMSVFFAAMFAYSGPKTLHIITREWGVESAAAPGAEVDAGLLQFAKMAPGTPLANRGGAASRRMSARVVNDDEFGDRIQKNENTLVPEQPTEIAYANFLKAVIGAIYLHAGREAAKTFVKSHILSRHLQISDLFKFEHPVRDLSRLCAREDFDYPVARILSETGRRSRSPVFVVGIYSGQDKLGEGAGPNLDEARIRACVAALKAWYLYSSGNTVRVPSDMEGGGEGGKKAWVPVHIDVGEIV